MSHPSKESGLFVSDEVLRRLCQISAFPIPEDEMVFFGLRGCLPTTDADPEFKTWHPLKIVDFNYQNPRCTLGQWRPHTKDLAVFPGSTIPTANYVQASVPKSGDGTNQLFVGRYHYVKGDHAVTKPKTKHKAFRQHGSRIYRRTSDDAIYENSDVAQVGNPWDNLHAAFGGSLNGSYSSAGCQVVLGYPKCQLHKESGPWGVFRANAYNIQQEKFEYFLFEARADLAGDELQAPCSLKLRCGAHESALPPNQQSLIRDVQTHLAQLLFYKGSIDGDFGPSTALATLNFQRLKLGPSLADGVFGPLSAKAIGLKSWPTI